MLSLDEGRPFIIDWEKISSGHIVPGNSLDYVGNLDPYIFQKQYPSILHY
jgi:hypothetical protein